MVLSNFRIFGAIKQHTMNYSSWRHQILRFWCNQTTRDEIRQLVLSKTPILVQSNLVQSNIQLSSYPILPSAAATQPRFDHSTFLLTMDGEGECSCETKKYKHRRKHREWYRKRCDQETPQHKQERLVRQRLYHMQRRAKMIPEQHDALLLQRRKRYRHKRQYDNRGKPDMVWKNTCV